MDSEQVETPKIIPSKVMYITKSGEQKTYTYDARKYYAQRLAHLKKKREDKKKENPELNRQMYSRKKIIENLHGLTQKQRMEVLQFIEHIRKTE